MRWLLRFLKNIPDVCCIVPVFNWNHIRNAGLLTWPPVQCPSDLMFPSNKKLFSSCKLFWLACLCHFEFAQWPLSSANESGFHIYQEYIFRRLSIFLILENSKCIPCILMGFHWCLNSTTVYMFFYRYKSRPSYKSEFVHRQLGVVFKQSAPELQINL